MTILVIVSVDLGGQGAADERDSYLSENKQGGTSSCMALHLHRPSIHVFRVTEYKMQISFFAECGH